MPDISDIIYSLRYQILTPVASTWGTCSTEGCDQGARGGSTCAICLCKKLDDATGGDHFAVDELYDALVRTQSAMLTVERISERLINGDRGNGDEDD